MNNKDLTGRRVLAVHAHPDDEVLFGGGTLADLAARGAEVTVITATLGEEGEVIGPDHQGLANHDQLGGYRAHELASSLAALGAQGIQLGGYGYFRDSGMADSSAHIPANALVNRVDEATDLLAQHFEALRPDAIITYGPDGGYGHPDHIAVHRAVHAAAPSEQRIWWSIFDRAAHYEALETMAPPQGWQLPSSEYLDNFTNPESALRFPLSHAALAAKKAAMVAHATQIWVADGTLSATNPVGVQAGIGKPELAPAGYGLSNLLLMPLLRHEDFQLGRGSFAADLVGVA